MPAHKGNKYAEGNDGGRPSPYEKKFNEQAYKLCLLGATDAELADFFNVCVDTIHEWRKVHKEFSEAIRAGKTVADIEVAHRLYESTGDRIVVERKPIKLKKVFWKDGKKHEEETVEMADEERVIPADYRSQSLWLRNRKSDKWRDKQEVDHTTNGKDIPSNTINLGRGVNPDENNAESSKKEEGTKK